MGEFWKRTIFGFLFAIVVIGGIFLGGMYTAIMLAAVVMLGSTEIANLYSKQDGAAIKNIVQSLSIFLFVFLATFAESPDTMEGAIFIAPIFFNIPLLIALFSKKHDYVKLVGATWLSMIFVAFPCGIMMMFYNEYFIGTDKGWLLLIFSILLIWINDIFAYLTGVSIGRHKLFERISPKKTIEGSIGGAVFTMLFAYLLNRFVLNVYFFDNYINDMQVVFLALGIVVFGTLGDLTESMMKRHAGVKDSGNLIPGHGGILDRFDATFMAIPFIFIYLTIIN
ncbi:MAG: phosphatidate cytidylyltransferase [Bacteroidales bacterium]|jgi:phosphatidate cytidylyltransferase|nr:phosphatidate cytidylyltransferase [Bacteroidales bacterium]MBO5848228.1 phosphatidate cytidylyltransferase [Bacteroidales bacterium]MBO5853571.1 phosphatidate cytidylyltransferase [Bacteroidales bacterium]